MAVTAKVEEAEAAAAVKTAKATEAEAEAEAAAVMAAQAVEAEAAAIKQQEWEQRCAERVKLLARIRIRAVCSDERDERISKLETVCAKQAQATMEMCEIILKMQKETIKA